MAISEQPEGSKKANNTAFMMIIISALLASTIGLIFLMAKGDSDLKNTKPPVGDSSPKNTNSSPTPEPQNFDIIIPDDLATPPADLESTPEGFGAF